MTDGFLSSIIKKSMEDLHFLRLWDIYNGLLTKTQQEITNLYFNCDLSLAEIAEEKGCSRQSVSDCLAVCRRQLEEFEEKLHFSRTLTEASLSTSFLLTDIGKWAESAGLSETQKKAVEEILDRDYSKEVDQAIKENADKLL